MELGSKDKIYTNMSELKNITNMEQLQLYFKPIQVEKSPLHDVEEERPETAKSKVDN